MIFAPAGRFVRSFGLTSSPTTADLGKLFAVPVHSFPYQILCYRHHEFCSFLYCSSFGGGIDRGVADAVKEAGIYDSSEGGQTSNKSRSDRFPANLPQVQC